MKELGYYNGRIGELSEMMIPMTDRVCWFGDGVYDAELCRNYHIFALDEHIERFYNSASMLEIEIPMDKAELKALLCELVRKLDTGDMFVYYQVTRGSGPRSHCFPEGKANLWVTLTRRKLNDDQTPIAMCSIEDTRFFHCNIKTLNLIPTVMANEQAKRAGCYECVFYRPGGRVTEGSHSNVHIIKDGAFITAPTDNLILPGIARARLIRACHRLGIPVYEKPYTLDELRAADEVITSNSGRLCARAGSLDGAPVGMRSGDLYTALHDAVIGEYYAETE